MPYTKEQRQVAQKRRYQRLKTKGMCISCAKVVSYQGGLRCQKCLKIKYKKEKTTREKHKTNNICFRCSSKVTNGTALCDTCKEKNNEFANKRIIILKEQGICVRCGDKQSLDKHTYCKQCLDKTKEASKKVYKDMKDKGICIVCNTNESLLTGVLCEPCKQKHAAQVKAYEQTPSGKLARTAARNNRRGKEITSVKDKKAILDKYGKICYYCKNELEYSHEDDTHKLTFDHATPIKRGGTNVIDNFVPACKSCNSRKGTKTLFEFLDEVDKQHA